MDVQEELHRARDRRPGAESVDGLTEWLLQAGLQGLTVGQLLQGFCQRLAGAGLPVLRGYAGVRTLHPRYASYAFVWYRDDGGIGEDAFLRGAESNPEYLQSPFRYILEGGPDRLHQRLDRPGPLNFPIFDKLRSEGGTDYYARMYRFRTDDGVIYSWTTDDPDGFTPQRLQLLESLLPALSLAICAAATYRLAGDVLATYIGTDAGRRVLSGEIDRGAVQRIGAVLFYADLRGFTRLADAMPGPELVALLDRYLDCMAKPVVAEGGEVLKFMGDGLLAVFETGEQPGQTASACAAALGAACEAWRQVREVNAANLAEGKPTMELDIALHIGEVYYGNVGSESRLDFTIIGPAVNEASRIEGLCRELAAHILVSEAFWEQAECRELLMSLGRHELRDIVGGRELFTVKAEHLARLAA